MTGNQDGLVVVVDGRLTPRFAATLLRTCEAAIDLLEDVPVRELWLRHDLPDRTGITTLVEFLVSESPWEGRSQIETIVLFSPSGDGGELKALLQPHYQIRLEKVTPELFDELPEALGER